MSKKSVIVAVLALALASCGGVPPGAADAPDLPAITVENFVSGLESLDRPAIVNVWASWCIPCRSEAPLLDAAHRSYGDRIEFVGVDVQDNQRDAKAFLAEFGLDFDHYFDKDRSIPNHYGGRGTPVTFFFGPGGQLISAHNGVIDERSLAIGIDELLLLEG